jgi:hypothetical protein
MDMKIHFYSERNLLYQATSTNIIALLDYQADYWLIDADNEKCPDATLLQPMAASSRLVIQSLISRLLLLKYTISGLPLGQILLAISKELSGTFSSKVVILHSSERNAKTAYSL